MVAHSSINHNGLGKLFIPFPNGEALPPYSTSPIVVGRIAVPKDFTPTIATFDFSVFVSTTNSGSHYWTIEVFRLDSANTAVSLGSFNTSADAANTWLEKQVSV